MCQEPHSCGLNRNGHLPHVQLCTCTLLLLFAIIFHKNWSVKWPREQLTHVAFFCNAQEQAVVLYTWRVNDVMLSCNHVMIA